MSKRALQVMCGVLAAIGVVGCAAMGADIVDTTPEATVPVGPDVIAAGQQLDVRLQQPLSSVTAEVNDEFEATTVADLWRPGAVLVPAGSVVHGRVAGVDDGGPSDPTTSLLLAFERIVVSGRSRELRACAVEAFQADVVERSPEKAENVAVGDLNGGILKGLDRTLPGVLVGGGLVSGAYGVHVELPAGTLLRIELERPVDLR